jgi:membrane peptidoglycan carboxypeptidase
MGREMGIGSWSKSGQYGVSITLGGAEVKMTELATAYGTIANNGLRVDLDPILEIHDSYGKLIYEKAPQQRRVVEEGVAFILSDILADNNARSLAFGPNSPIYIPTHRVSVKTGTTDNKRDSWTVGYTQDILVTTWVGNNDNTPMSPFLTSGVTGAAPMWNKIMIKMLEGRPNKTLAVPSDVVKKFCMGQERYFIRGTENSIRCDFRSTPTPFQTQ